MVLVFSYIMSMAVAAADCTVGSSLELTELEQFAAYLASKGRECAFEEGCEQRCAWRKSGAETDVVKNHDFKMAVLQYWGSQNVCVSSEDPLLYYESWCGVTPAVGCGPDMCLDNDKDGFYAWEENIVSTSDENPERTCTGDPGQFLCAFDQSCQYIEELSRWRCLDKDCSTESCDAFTLETVSMNNQEVVVRVRMEEALVVLPSFLDLRIEYASSALNLIDQRSISAHSDLKVRSNYVADGIVRLTMYRTSGSVIRPGPLVELYFQRISDDEGYVRFTQDDYAQTHSVAPKQGDVQEDLSNDNFWGEPVSFDTRSNTGPRVLLHYGFDGENSDLTYSDIPTENDMCGLMVSCNQETNAVRKRRILSTLKDIQAGSVGVSNHIEGVYGQGVWLNGYSDHLEFPITFTAPLSVLNQNYSWSSWVFAEGFSSTEPVGSTQLLVSHNNNGERTQIGLYLKKTENNKNVLEFFVGSYQSPVNKYIISPDFPSKSWVHVGFSLDISRRVASVYLDGQKILSTVSIGRSAQDVFSCPGFASPPVEGIQLHRVGDVIGGKLKGKVYYASVKNNKSGVSSVDENGSGLKDVVRSTDFSAQDPDYSAIWDKVVYVSDASGSYEVWVVNADGDPASRQRITDGFGYTLRKVFAKNPKWAPDGSGIVFESNAFDLSTGDNTLAKVFQMYFIEVSVDQDNVLHVVTPSGEVEMLSYRDNIRVLIDKTTAHAYRISQNQLRNHFNAQWLKGPFDDGVNSWRGRIYVNTADEFWKGGSTGYINIASTLTQSDYAQQNFCPSSEESKILAVQRFVKPLTRDLATNDCTETCAGGTVCYRGQCSINRDVSQVLYTCLRAQRVWKSDDSATNFSDSQNGCLEGGAFIRYGRDDNENNIFDVSKETRGTKVFCTEKNKGKAYIKKIDLLTTNVQSPCLTKGGIQIQWGYDRTKNNALDDNEIEGKETFCHGSKAAYVKDIDDPSKVSEIKDIFADELFAAAFSPDGERIIVSANYPKRPSIFKIDNPLSQSPSDECRPDPSCGGGTMKCISGKCVDSYIENLSEESIKVENISWKSIEAYYPCYWVGAYRQPQSAVMVNGFKGALDEVFLHSYVREDSSFDSEASRGKLALLKSSGEDISAQKCTTSSDCSAYETCQSVSGEKQCVLSLTPCNPSDANACASGTCMPRPSTVPLPAGTSDPDRYAWVCSSECSTLPVGVVSTQCLSKECSTGMCQYCSNATCVECTVDASVSPSKTYGCPDTNSYYCSAGRCMSECYAYQNNQSVYLCDSALQYCEQGRCLPNSWDWTDLSPATFAGMGEMQFRSDVRYTTAIDELYPIVFTAYGIGDYARAPEVLVEAKMPSPPQGSAVVNASEWFEIGRVTVLNKTDSEAETHPYVLQTPYRITQVRLRLQNPPSANGSFTSTGFLQQKENRFYNNTWIAGYNENSLKRKATGSRYIHGYSAAISPYLSAYRCTESGISGCNTSFDPQTPVASYLRGGQDTVLIKSVTVNGDSVRNSNVVNRVCSYENTVDPVGSNDVEKKLYFGDVSKEVSLQKERCGSSCTGVVDELKTFDVAAKGFGLLNCNFALSEEINASYVVSNITILPSYQRGNITETANGCLAEDSSGTASPCYEWIGSDVTYDPYDASRTEEVLEYPRAELELTPASSFSSSNTAGQNVEIDGTNFSWSQLDSDGDGVPDDGDGSGNAYDNPCLPNASCSASLRQTVKSVLLKDNLFCTSQSHCAVAGVASGIVSCNTISNTCVVNMNALKNNTTLKNCACDDNCVRQANPTQSLVSNCSNDADGDGIVDSSDNCPNNPNANQLDTDSDRYGDECDQDDDADSVIDAEDNCSKIFNRNQEDTDGDARGDVCDEDMDGDGLCNSTPSSVSVCVTVSNLLSSSLFDNCSKLTNPNQTDSDRDGKGDGCDIDLDNDGTCERSKRWVDEPDVCVTEGGFDACPYDANKTAAGECGCGVSENDDDGDGVKNCFDNCPRNANPSQQDMDGDGEGNVCDSDADGDDVADNTDNCVLVKNPLESCNPETFSNVSCNSSSDCFNSNASCRSGVCIASSDMTLVDASRIRNMRHECRGLNNYCTTDGVCALQNNNDGDSLGDVCDADDDGDGLADANDNCVFVASSNRSDADRDGIGDLCDSDSDGDMVSNLLDNCPLLSNPDQTNTDLVNEGSVKYGDACDADDDNDGICDANPSTSDTCRKHGGTLLDNCPLNENSNQLDTDADGYGNVCDLDDDNDGVGDAQDNCPLAVNANQLDADRDGIGNVCDNCAQYNPNQEDSNNNNIGDECE